MARSIAADGPRAGSLLIQQRYNECEGTQFLRELCQNGFEADATRIQLGIHWSGVNFDWSTVELPQGCKLHPGRYRMVYYDNGCGMGSEMLDYMAGLLDLDSKNQSAGDPHGNFGMGARVSLLPWNKAGVIIASWSPEFPSGQLMWIRFVPDSGASDKLGYYEAISLNWIDENGLPCCDEVAPADCFPEFIEGRPEWLGPQANGETGTGTMYLLLGDTGQEHTFLGPQGDWKTHTGPNYLSHRYWEHPSNVEIRYEDPRAADPDLWASRLRDRCEKTTLDGSIPESDQQRVFNEPVRAAKGIITGLHARKGTPAPESEVIDLPCGGKIHVHLLPESKAKGGGGRRDADRPAIAVLYKGELYHRRESAADYQRFAVIHSKVYRRLSIIIEPRLADGIDDPQGGVFPSGSRSSLIYVHPRGPKGDRPGGQEFPWNKWQGVFVDEMPAFVHQALESFFEDDEDEVDQDVVDQIAAPFMDLFNKVTWVETRDGDTAGKSGGEIQRRKRRVNPTPNPKPAPTPGPGPDTVESLNSGAADPEGDVAGEESNVPAKIPECRFDTGAFEEEKDAKVRIGVKYVKGEKNTLGTVYIDRSFPLIKEVMKYWVDRFVDQHARDVEKAVGLVYRTAMACRVGQLLAMMKTMGLTHHDLEDTLLSNEALTTSLYGLYSEHTVLKQKTTKYRRIK